MSRMERRAGCLLQMRDIENNQVAGSCQWLGDGVGGGFPAADR
jgi:hypothetical protein